MQGVAAEQGLACRPIMWHHAAQQAWLILTHPENAHRIPDPGDAARVLSLERDLQFAQARLAKLERHPYVRLGMKVVSHPLYANVRNATSRLRKAA